MLIVGLGSYFTLRPRFVQFRHFIHMFSVFKESLHSSGGQLSSLQALMLSLTCRVGAGNIAGVGTAVTLGGPGAVFWMWVTALALLIKVGLRVLKDYDAQRKAGAAQPVFDGSRFTDLDLDRAAWPTAKPALPPQPRRRARRSCCRRSAAALPSG